MATVSGIYIKKSKQEQREEIQEGFFKADFGLEGDVNSGPGPRQVCLLRREDRIEVDGDSRNGLCFSRFNETLQIEGLNLEDLKKDAKIRVGHALLRVASCGKKCWPDCEIVKSKSSCSLTKTARFMTVQESGIIKKDDSVTLL
ncbi:hypothetical protein EXM22_00380 [Oceanispirochaeta crateris]|uniref:MOSC domain-containing protein n=1 Tax=Oceanispirochaeta crateris TaxID=2518645 RepID=A0A5C1QG77_9SPIO|nr:hypothetical protein [Oceanispirochaeta crateris]QEN06521.1 hypothetical protein EXM22_00380 [Oceanispirochaeta crateris]